MITDDQLRLITAAIDGELSPAEARRLRKLLESSPEARAVHAQLKADSDRLHKLSLAPAPADLQARVMRRIAALTPPPVLVPKAEPAARPAASPNPETLPHAPRRFRAWVPAAVAASLLISVTGGSLWYFNRTNAQSDSANSPNRAPVNNVPDPNWTNSLPSDTDPRPSAPAPRPHKDNSVVILPDLPQPHIVQDSLAVAPEPRSIRPDLVAFPPIVTPTFDHLRIRIPYLKSVAEFDRAEARQELVEELGLEPAFRVDLFARDPARGAEVFQAAAKAAGVNLFVDATTLERLKKRQVTALVIYAESLSAAELAELFGKLSAEDAKISPRVFDSLHVIPVTASDNADIKNILGVDPGLFKRAMPGPDRGEKGDPTKPISAGTADQIVKSVSGNAKLTEKSAVLLTCAPTTARTAPNTSVELKQFLAKRGDRNPKAVPVVIVIRPGNG
jgi:negative regulator of sigma E activity